MTMAMHGASKRAAMAIAMNGAKKEPDAATMVLRDAKSDAATPTAMYDAK